MNQVLTRTVRRRVGLGESLAGRRLRAGRRSSPKERLLFVAAQAGFIDGPRVLANMAHDSWMPHWFANLSERLATHNGIMLMGISALAALVYTGGNVDHAGDHVLDQRVPDVLAVDDRHVPPLVAIASREPALAAAALPCSSAAP